MNQERGTLSRDEQDEVDHQLLEEASLGRLENLRELLDLGADPNRMHEVDSGETSSPMLEAAKGAHADCVMALLVAGGRFDVRNSHEVTPLHSAAVSQNDEFCVWIVSLPQAIEAAPRINVHQLLKDFCLFGLPKTLGAALDLGYLREVDPKKVSELLAEAALSRRLECFQRLLAHAKRAGCEDGLDLSKSFHQSAGNAEPHIEFMRWMLENTQVAKHLASGPSAVQTMLSWNHPRAARLLVEGGYLPRPSDDSLATSLIEAVKGNHLASAELLLEWGADRHADFKERSLLQLARKEPMRRLLRSARSQRVMEGAMGGEDDAPAAPRRDPGPL